MAEAFGLVASIFATVQIADRVISLCKRYIESIRDAPSDLRTILVEVSAMKAVLESIKFLVTCDNEHPTISNSLRATSGPVEGCLEAMKGLEALFRVEPASSQGPGRPRGLKDQALVTLATLAWPLKESKARKLMQDLATYKSTIGLALAADTAHLMRDTARKTTQIQEALSESQRHEVFKWLEDIDPSSLHYRAQNNYEPGTCDWAARHPEWPRFLGGREHCLWIHGIPGSGKTILASRLIEKIERHCEASGLGNLISVYYYCYFGHGQDESSSLLKWILNRLCREAEAVPEYLWKLFKHGGAPSITSLLAAIEHALEQFDAVYITVDAIDESNPREDLLKIIRDLATDQRFNKVRLLVTSREYFDIEKVMAAFSKSISMKNPSLDADIYLYTQSRLGKEILIRDWPKELQQDTLEALSHGAKGMFRWVVCQIDVLKRIKISSIKEALTRLPRTLNEAYDRIFESISEDDLPFVNAAMKWLCFEIKLHVGEEVCFDMQTLAEAVDEDIQRENPDGMELFHNAETLRDVCGCLITVAPEILNNGQQRFNVSFAHYTVLEYLASNDRYNPDPFYTLEENDLVLERAKLIFERALCVSDDDFDEYKAVAGRQEDRITTIPNFGSYCACTSMDMIFYFDQLLTNQKSLFSLAFELLKANEYHFGYCSQIWRQRCLAFENQSSEDIEKSRFSSEIQWKTMPATETGVLVRLLLYNCLDMAKELLRRVDLRKTFNAHLSFIYFFEYISSRHPGSYGATGNCYFEGTLTDCFAGLIPYGGVCGVEAFKLLIEFGAELFAPQGALIPFIQFHCHMIDCGDYCVLEKLLSLGANPNMRPHYITPLQIAVARLDVEGVATLLRAAADPNAKGDSVAPPWPRDSTLFDFNILNGSLPLQICKRICRLQTRKHFERWMYVSPGEELTVRSTLIEAALLEYGAKD